MLKKIIYVGIPLLIAALLCSCTVGKMKANGSSSTDTESKVTGVESSGTETLQTVRGNETSGVATATGSSATTISKVTSSKTNRSEGASSVASQAKDTVELSTEQENRIKNDYLKFYFGKNPDYPDGYSIKNVKIRHYYGTYNECVVMMIDGYRGFTAAIRSETIAGIVFLYSSGQGFEIWRNGDFYNLKSAYEKGLLTKSDIETINTLHRGKYSFLYK